jgi:arylsulfatase A
VILDVLEKKQLASNTLVIFTSDNGAHWLPSDINKWKHRANAEWRGQKADLWEGGHRVPLVVRWPGQITPGSRSDATVCLTDLLATLAELWGESLPDNAGEDSFSILPLWTGAAASGPRRSSIVHHSADGTFAIRRGPWKLAMKLGSHGFSEPRNEEPTPGGPQGQLYHLNDDPGETRNRWLEEPQVVAELTALLERYQREGRSRPID